MSAVHVSGAVPPEDLDTLPGKIRELLCRKWPKLKGKGNITICLLAVTGDCTPHLCITAAMPLQIKGAKPEELPKLIGKMARALDPLGLEVNPKPRIIVLINGALWRASGHHFETTIAERLTQEWPSIDGLVQFSVNTGHSHVLRGGALLDSSRHSPSVVVYAAFQDLPLTQGELKKTLQGINCLAIVDTSPRPSIYPQDRRIRARRKSRRARVIRIRPKKR